jgi:hypothetical protein
VWQLKALMAHEQVCCGADKGKKEKKKRSIRALCLAAFTSHPGRLKFMFILYIIEENAMSRIICRITRNISNKGISGIKEYRE